MLAKKIVEIARAEIGVTEINGSNKGPRVDQYKAATNLPPHESWPWCAAFIDWVVKQAMEGGSYTFHRPTTAGAFDLINWSLEQDNSTWTRRNPGTDIEPGDIVVFNFSHVGFATTTPIDGVHFGTVEGNTDVAGSREGGGVFAKSRRVDQVRARIRFRV
jgi:hypothetical protein